MASPKLSLEKTNEIREPAVAWGKIVARRALEGPAHAEPLDFAAMERIAQVAVAGLTQGTLATLLEQQALALPCLWSPLSTHFPTTTPDCPGNATRPP